ncbi:hypothetical protein [Nisaea nitritireducens]|uniref:hypothetical protein n=1 Tax=Nisaea nitritireducens TaxID=568392 RepID=UPI001866521B|nr:hypothetical protein [Nisaea nitritireducens]
MEAITYTGSYAESDSAHLKSKGLQKLGISNMSGFRTSFNDVYSSEAKDSASEASGPVTGTGNADSGYSAVVTALLDYMHKTPEERYFEAILKEKGLTPEQYDALPPKEKTELREMIMDEVRERMIADAKNQALEGQQV